MAPFPPTTTKKSLLLRLSLAVGPRHRLRKARTGSYQFGVTGKVKGDVTSAALWVYKMKDAHDVHEQTLVLTELHFSKRQRLRERSLVARLDTQVQEGWVRFDITRLVQRWIKSKTPASLQMLAIRCKTCHRTNYRAIFGVKVLSPPSSLPPPTPLHPPALFPLSLPEMTL